jgi:hypothetical protein
MYSLPSFDPALLHPGIYPKGTVQNDANERIIDNGKKLGTAYDVKQNVLAPQSGALCNH